MQVTIPDDVVADQLIENIVDVVAKRMDEKLKLVNKTLELPPYPNKSEVKRLLGIGDDKLGRWIALGLKTQQWSSQDIRIERSELQRFLKSNFEF